MPIPEVVGCRRNVAYTAVAYLGLTFASPSSMHVSNACEVPLGVPGRFARERRRVVHVGGRIILGLFLFSCSRNIFGLAHDCRKLLKMSDYPPKSFPLRRLELSVPFTRPQSPFALPPTVGRRMDRNLRFPSPEGQLCERSYPRSQQSMEQGASLRRCWSERRQMDSSWCQHYGNSVMKMHPTASVTGIRRISGSLGETPAFHSQQLKTPENLRRKAPFCSFCRTNGESQQYYTSHRLREKNRITCPILRKYVCRFCSATGDNAHTDSYCPENPNRGFKHSMRAIMTTPHNSCGLRANTVTPSAQRSAKKPHRS